MNVLFRAALGSILVSGLLSAAGVGDEPVSDQIAAIENGLLPVNIFAGEQPYQLRERMKFYKVPGLSVTVIKDFKILWTKTYGIADQELQTPVTGQTLFNIGSLSKGVAALTTLSLIHQGKFNLDDDVNRLMTSWKVPENAFTRGKAVTPALLMNHSGGAMHHFGVGYFRDAFPTITQVLNGEPPATHRPTTIDKIPGTRFQYSNPGYSILQQLVEDVTGEPIYTVARNNIFDKLGMTRATFQQPLPVNLEKFAAAGHRGYATVRGKRLYFANIAAGGLWTTSDDYARYVIELQKSWHGKSNKVISKELTRKMLSPGVAKEYGYGVFMRKIGSQKYFGHMGDSTGFMAGFISHTTDGYGAVILTNSNTSPELIRELNKSIAKYYRWAEFVPATLKTVKISKQEMEAISGRYRSGHDSVFHILFRNDQLVFAELGNEKMYHLGNLRFKVKRRDGEIVFTKGPGGEWTAVYHFADELGRLSGTKQKAIKMKPGEKTPRELLQAGRLEEAATRYRAIFKDNPGDDAVSESRLNRLGYQLLGQNKLPAALCVFKLNTEFYPDSANVHDSYGEALAKSGDTKGAIRQYEKALELDPQMRNAKNMLKKLED